MLRCLQTLATLQRFHCASLVLAPSRSPASACLSRVVTKLALVADLWVTLTSAYLRCGSVPTRKPSGHFCQFRWLSTPLSKLVKPAVCLFIDLQLLGSSYLKQKPNSLKYTEIVDQISEGFCFKMKQKCSHFSSLCQLLHHRRSLKLLTYTDKLVPHFSRKRRWVISACQPVCWTDRRKAIKTKQLFEAQIFLLLWFSVSIPSITPSSYDPLKPIS